jgi:hypothetical protein
MRKLKMAIALPWFVTCVFVSLGFSVESNSQTPTPTSAVGTPSQEQSVAPSPATAGGELDFNSAAGQETQVASSQQTAASPFWAWSLIALSIAAISLAFFFGRKSKLGSTSLDLFQFPYPAKLAVSFILFAFGLTHALAAITVYLDTRVVYASAQEYFFYLKPARLTALSHAHLMAIATMDGIVSFFFAMRYSSRSYGFSSAVITMTFIGIFGDVGSWWLTKYFGESFELLSMFTGIFFSLGFAVMSLAVFRDLWFFQTSQARTAQ